MLKTCIALASLVASSVISTVASASASEPLSPVMIPFFDGMKRHELAIISNVATRCGTVTSIVGQVVARDTPDEAVSESLIELGEGLLVTGLYTNAALLKHRGKDIDMTELQDRALKTQDRFTKIYFERMTQNQINSGEMWGGDEVIKSDLEFCQSLTILFSDEWLKTMETNNWDYWDGVFK